MGLREEREGLEIERGEGESRKGKAEREGVRMEVGEVAGTEKGGEL